MQVGNFTKGGIPFALELFAVIKNGFPVSTGSMILNTSLGAGWARVLGTESVLTLTWHLHSLTHGVSLRARLNLLIGYAVIQVLIKSFLPLNSNNLGYR